MSTVAELLQYSMAFCGRSDVAEKYYLGELDEGGTTLKNCLLFCYNVVADDLVRHHFPMKITEFFTTTDKKIA